ncbi:MAG: DUF1848 domain-containing protein [Deltaproteobacteria bacterium]|nr:DUF1848 domain-containing protein [Deltaproteobacteria bacterium]
MIISCSRRTDIPANYSRWFMKRIAAGYCTVVNPLNNKQVSFISLKPEDVEVIIFWTKNPKPLLPYLNELTDKGFLYYFQFTITGYGQTLEPGVPQLDQSIETFKFLCKYLSPAHVIWRYDPIIITRSMSIQYHLNKFTMIAEQLSGYSNRVVISLVDHYRKAKKQLNAIGSIDFTADNNELIKHEIGILTGNLKEISNKNGFEIVSCAEAIDLKPYGIKPGKCIDDELIKRIFHFEVQKKKDPVQREECGCVISRDIGAYDSCKHGCKYCYASSHRKRENHNEDSPSLLGWYDAQQKSNQINNSQLEFNLK